MKTAGIQKRSAAAILVAGVLAGLSPGAAIGQTQAASHSALLADTYAAAMKCFVANVHARGVWRDVGDEAGATRYEAGTRASFEAARVVASTLGYSEEQMHRDVTRTRERELPTMVSDPNYFRSTVATCRTLGLMPTA